MGSPETCEKCGGVGRHVEGKRGFTRFPCPNATPTPPAPDAGARIEEAHRALGKPGRMDDDGCCVGCGRSVQPSPCCPDFPVWPGPCRSCYAYDEEQRDAGAAEDHPSEASRDHGAEGSDRAVGEALPTRGDVGRPEATRDPVFLLQWRERNRPVRYNRWQVDSVWFTRQEAEDFAKAHAHRWGSDKGGPCWQVYCVPANGDLAALLKVVTKRDAALRGTKRGPA